MPFIEQLISLIVLLHSVFGGSHDEFLNSDWTFIGTVNRFCTSELLCGGAIPSCDSSTNGKTVQDRIDVNNCVAQGCESGTQWNRNTYYCESSRKEEFLSKGWSYIGNYDRFCTSELDCTGTIPYCDSSTNGKRHWMKNTVGFPQYVDNFVLNGYDSFQIVMDIEDTQALVDIGITLKGHQQRIIKQISLLRSKMKQDEGEKEGVATVKASVIRDERTNLLLPQPKTGNCEQRDFRL
eukprot:644594_1